MSEILIIHQRNLKMLYAVWITLVIFTVLNVLDDVGATLYVILGFGIPFASIITYLWLKRTYIKLTMYMITVYALLQLFLINYVEQHYINLLFLLLPLLITALYPDIKNFLLSYVCTTAMLLFFTYSYGNLYFVQWERYYLIHIVGLTTVIALIIFYGSNLSERLRISAQDQAKRAIDEKEETRRISQEMITYLAYNDSLTGLPNRNAFFANFTELTTENKNEESLSAVLFYFDIDNFKRINDTLGHNAGDMLLKEVAIRFNTYINSGTLYRLGGDEFVWTLVNINDDFYPETYAKQLIELFREPFSIDGIEVCISPSVGITIYPIDGNSPEQLIKHADMAMYRAKESGKNTYVFYNSKMGNEQEQQFYLETDLRNALERKELVLLYQPQIEIKTGKLKGFEALLRWRHPKYDLVPPNKFIPLAEETNLILPIGEWVIREACLQAKKWNDKLSVPTRISVNLSMKQFLQQSLIDNITKILNETNLSPDCLELEITESMTMDPIHATEILNELKGIGVKIAIDDFGTGYSSLAYLKRFPVDQLKIDRTFIRDMAKGSIDFALVKTIISIANNLNLEVVAEGVENEEQLYHLGQLQCDLVQGYLISEPIPPDQAELFFSEHNELMKA